MFRASKLATTHAGFAALLALAVCSAPLAAQPLTPAPQAPAAPAAPNPEASDDSSIFHTTATQVEQSAHAWIVIDTHRRELVASTVLSAKHAMSGGGMSGGGMLGGVASTAMSLGAMAAGPFGGMAASALGLLGIGRAHPKMPSMRDTWALQGTKAGMSVAAQTPSVEISYADMPGVDPDAYEPVLVKLAPTNDNWRVVVQTEQQFSRGGMSAPTFSEQRVPIHVESLGKGHVRITPASALDPGEYGVALRPLKGADANQSDGGNPMGIVSRMMAMSGAGITPSAGVTAASLWQTVWDFGIEGTPAPPKPIE